MTPLLLLLRGLHHLLTHSLLLVLIPLMLHFYCSHSVLVCATLPLCLHALLCLVMCDDPFDTAPPPHRQSPVFLTQLPLSSLVTIFLTLSCESLNHMSGPVAKPLDHVVAPVLGPMWLIHLYPLSGNHLCDAELGPHSCMWLSPICFSFYFWYPPS